MRKAVGFCLVLLFLGLVVFSGVFALDPVEDLQKQINDLSHLRQLSIEATQPLEEELSNLEKKIGSIQFQLKEADRKTNELEENISEREQELVDKYGVLSSRVRSYYKLSRQSSPLLMFLISTSASNLTRQLSYKSAVADEDRGVIVSITTDLVSLEEDKASLEERKVVLAGLREKFESEAAFFEGEIKGAKDYQAELSGKIADLTVKQQSILAEKSGTFQTTVGDVPLADDPASRPDYNPGFSPAFAAFSFGAPHFKGMSQYGAFGRAKSGQNAETILKAYYGNGIEIKKDYSTGININVESYEVVDIETYTKRIYEVPNSWGDEGGMEALKAQAVAARSYALARTNNGAGSICATEACQVYKPANKGGNWEQAVNDTRGWVLMAGGQPFSSWYASTSGGYQESYSHNGYSTPAFWDTSSGRSGWTSQAYEKIAGSPWFYKGWYKSRSGDSCGRSHPWLTSEEMADVLNAWVVIVKHGQSDDRVTPIGACWGGSPYSINELRSRAEGLSGGYLSVSSVSVIYSDNGITANVTFQTNRGSVTVGGLDFKKIFNLRAPGRIALKSGLFNIEMK